MRTKMFDNTRLPVCKGMTMNLANEAANPQVVVLKRGKRIIFYKFSPRSDSFVMVIMYIYTFFVFECCCFLWFLFFSVKGFSLLYFLFFYLFGSGFLVCWLVVSVIWLVCCNVDRFLEFHFLRVRYQSCRPKHVANKVETQHKINTLKYVKH